jgi:hypothetical protein
VHFLHPFEPLFYGRKILWYKYSFLIIIAGLAMIMNVEVSYFAGMLYALISILGVYLP